MLPNQLFGIWGYVVRSNAMITPLNVQRSIRLLPEELNEQICLKEWQESK